MADILVKPPAYDATQWSNPLVPPAGYTGTKFGFELVEDLIQVIDDETVRILGTVLRVAEICPGPTPNDPNHPIDMDLVGLVRMFTISIWADRVEICVYRITGQHLSTMFPETEEQLRCALRDVVDSCA